MRRINYFLYMYMITGSKAQLTVFIRNTDVVFSVFVKNVCIAKLPHVVRNTL